MTCEPVSGGDITGVIAGSGLSGGAASGNASLSVNPAVVQSRVTGTCSAGQSIRGVASDGTVTCGLDDVTVLLQALKEQQVIVQRQAAENADLKARLERLERLLATGP